jgi:catechol 2,3-dioxygenase-like lactoylglutathione lyase family enzyme
MPGGIHHSVAVVRDLDESLRFYRDGIGLDVLIDREVEGDWPTLFGAPSRHLRVAFLGDRQVPDVRSGVLELIAFADGDAPGRRPLGPSIAGLFMLSFFVDVEETLKRLVELAIGGTPQRVTQSTPNGPVSIATVRDPDDVLVLLTPGSITQTPER